MNMDHESLMAFSAKLTSTIGGLAIIWTMFRQFIPYELKHHLLAFAFKYTSFMNPYDCFIIEEYAGERMNRHELYIASKAYLSDHCSRRARTCRIELGKDSDRFLVSIGERSEVADYFNGVKIWWRSSLHEPRSNPGTSRNVDEEKRYYTLTFHKRHRQVVEGSYLRHVLKKGRAITVRNRQRRLFTNNPDARWTSYFTKTMWSHVAFHHPSTFETLAMDPVKKQEIINDLNEFRNGKEYYSRIGKAWKRGYLLYGPPGTGKSSMISAIANFLEYDIYDLELTTVKSNSELRKLFIETTGKSIIVIEDIDCSLDLTGKRKGSKSKEEEDKDNSAEEKKRKSGLIEEEKEKVTLSGLLNFIDGLWSACGEERILIFTTNHVEKLDPALIRTGRMDKHIEMSYCDFESFRVLAKNYLGIQSHDLYGTISKLLEEVKITPSDVAENLMCVGFSNADPGVYLEKLIKSLEKKKESEEPQKKDDIAEEVHENGNNGVKIANTCVENGVVQNGN
ncbi:P-loop containing nucleoside triphosphate hydrolases superfamily protein [Rhynchospora pubera]|uniref:P-loop containing nucleoside triphosphate hydrolases superfamily protein n=1 Tax=Rhynchospora pubera TaxID=906938 RepID=A0AAV8DRN1_9POAL|nr:P-loop containing nucleoside triphosphate hydrolases superfamily protein [Rhynchospora pubera]